MSAIQYIMQLSANNLMTELMFWSISLMYNRNINGPRTVPCGIPDLTGRKSDTLLSNINNSLLSFNHPFSYPIQEITLCAIVFLFGS